MSTHFMDMEMDENLLNYDVDLTCFDNVPSDMDQMDPNATIHAESMMEEFNNGEEIVSDSSSLRSCSESETNEVLTSSMNLNRRSWPLARYYPSSEAFYQYFPKYKEEDLLQQEAKKASSSAKPQKAHKPKESKKAKEKEVDYLEEDWDVSVGSVSAASDEDFVLEENSSRSSKEDYNHYLRHSRSERRATIRRSGRRTRYRMNMNLLDDDFAFLDQSDDGYSVESSHQVKRTRSRRIQISDEDDDPADHSGGNHVESSKSIILSDDLFDQPLDTEQMEADIIVAVSKEEEKKASGTSSNAVPRSTRGASRDDGSRRLTMTMRPSTSSVYDLYNMKVKGYEVSLTHERATYVLSLSDVCFGYLQSKPSLKLSSISVCFCGVQANIRQAEFVFCQSGKYCNHFVHKHCVDNIYYVKMAHYALYFRDFVCSKCLESEPTRPLLTSKQKSSSSQRESRSHRPMKVVKAVTAPPPQPPPPKPEPEPLKLLQVSSSVDSSHVAHTTVRDDNDGATYAVSLSNEYYGTMIMEPPLPAGKQRSLKLCFCQKSYGPRTEFLYCVKGLSCNHYVHPTCCKQLASKKLHVYFRNNYTCDMCAVESPSEESKTYWDEADFVEEGEDNKELEEKKDMDKEREEPHNEEKEETKEVEKDELVESGSFPENNQMEEEDDEAEEEAQPELLRVDSSSIASEDDVSVTSQEVVFIRKCMP